MMRSLQTLTGMNHALFLFCQSLTKTHPDPSAMLPALDVAEQHGLAHLEAQPIGDATIDGYRHVMDGLRKAIEVAGATRP
jgi:hypothetical protein